MRCVKKGFLYFSALITAFCCFLNSADQVAAADVCSSGTGLPPFISSGADPNLLLVMDNSGSMLDMAYVDADQQCFDEGYLINSSGVPDVTMQYAGLFESTAWYKWQEAVPLWENTAYDKGDLVYADGVIFKALIAGTSAGENIYEDSVVNWENILRPTWKKNTYYHAHSFMFNLLQNKVWYTAAGGNSSATATGPDTDTILSGLKLRDGKLIRHTPTIPMFYGMIINFITPKAVVLQMEVNHLMTRVFHGSGRIIKAGGQESHIMQVI